MRCYSQTFIFLAKLQHSLVAHIMGFGVGIWSLGGGGICLPFSGFSEFFHWSRHNGEHRAMTVC